MLIGYARVSTREQNLDLQLDALRRAGVADRDVYTDKASGAKTERPGLDAVTRTLREGDTLVVWRMDRLGRSQRHMVNLLCDLDERGITVRSITEGIDTATATGKIMVQLVCLMAEWERVWIQERTGAGLSAARERGRTGGRPAKLSGKRRELARRLYVEGEQTVEEIAETLGVSVPTLYRAVRDENGDMPAARQRPRTRHDDKSSS